MDILDAYPQHVIPEPNSGCWICTYATGGKGYARLPVNGRLATAHRVSYELSCGPIPKGYEIDHLCRNKLCVNPGHLEAVTPQENVRRAVLSREKERGGTCPKGHPLNGGNSVLSTKGIRRCRECQNIRQRRYRAKADTKANHGRNSRSSFNSGYAAYVCGISRDACAYKSRRMIACWQSGWDEAQRLTGNVAGLAEASSRTERSAAA